MLELRIRCGHAETPEQKRRLIEAIGQALAESQAQCLVESGDRMEHIPCCPGCGGVKYEPQQSFRMGRDTVQPMRDIPVTMVKGEGGCVDASIWDGGMRMAKRIKRGEPFERARAAVRINVGMHEGDPTQMHMTVYDDGQEHDPSRSMKPKREKRKAQSCGCG